MNNLTGNKCGTLLGGVEAGGTKFNCVVGRAPDDIVENATFSTTTPEETLSRASHFFHQAEEKYGKLGALGVASFGPVDLNKKSKTYGHITSTPKPDWSFTDIVGSFSDRLNIPIAFETDVNGSALGEGAYGAARGLKNFVYVTVGTGIGAGVVVDSKLLNGITHPEIGHILIPHKLEQDPFKGCCPFHGDCLEGLASGPAINARWHQPAQELAEDHPAWDLQAQYLAMLCVNLSNSFSPEKIILGGGVMAQTHLYPRIRQTFLRLMNGYLPADLGAKVDGYIVPPFLEGKSGVIGSLVMARSAIN